MKTKLLSLYAALVLAGCVQAQTLVDNYSLATRVDSTAWIDITGVDSLIVAPTATTYTYARSARLPIGFQFRLAGTLCQYFSTNVNGTVSFSNHLIPSSGYYDTPLGAQRTTGLSLPKVEPFGYRGQWDSTCYTRFATLGTADSHILVVQTRMGVYGMDSSHLCFQVQLHEATGEVRIVYGVTEGPLPTHTTQTGVVASYNDLIFIDLATHGALRATTSITQTNAAGVWPIQWRCYSLMPDAQACPYPPAVSVSASNPNAVSITWVPDSAASAYRITLDPLGLDTIVTGDTLLLTNLLNGATTYSGTFGGVCDSVHSSYRTRTFSFNTSCGTVRHLPWTANFQTTAFNNCWTLRSPSPYRGGWDVSSGAMSSFYASDNITAYSGWLVSPMIDLPATGDAELQWDYRANAFRMEHPTVLVKVMVCDSINTVDTSSAEWETIFAIRHSISTYKTFRVGLNQWRGHRVRVAFVRNSTGGEEAFVDNVSVVVTSQPGIRMEPIPIADAGGGTTIRAAIIVPTGDTATVSWHSTMLDRGLAAYIGESDTHFTLSYLVDGIDTVTAVIATATSADTDVVTFRVRDCSTRGLTWTEDFENGVECWELRDCGTTPSGWHLATSNNFNSGKYLYVHNFVNKPVGFSNSIVSRPITVPSLPEGHGVALAWQMASWGNYTPMLAIRFEEDSVSTLLADIPIARLSSSSILGDYIIYLDSVAGRTGRLVLEQHAMPGATSCSSVSIDNIVLRYARVPLVEHNMPQRVYVGDTIPLQTTLLEGVANGLHYSWTSVFDSTGRAVMSNTDSTIVYHVGGVDTLTVQAINNYGTSSDTATVLVCPPVNMFPWQADFSSEGCWYNMPGSDWEFSGNYLQVWGDHYFEGTVVSPALVVPTDTGTVLTWKVDGTSRYTVSISTGRYDDWSTYTTVLYDTARNGFQPRSISLAPYVGDTIRVAFHLDHQYTIVRIDSLILTNRNAPLVHLSAPQHVFADGAATVRAFYDRGEAGSTISWHSAMASRGDATLLTPTQTNLAIRYHTSGTDTVWARVANTFGSDSARVIFTVSDCDTVLAEGWTVNFSNDYDCWYRPVGCNWTRSSNSICSSGTTPFDSRIISQAIRVPANADDSLVVECTARATGSQQGATGSLQAHTMYLLVTDSDYTNPSLYDTLVADTSVYYQPITHRAPLGAYANKVIHIALVNNPITLASMYYDNRILYVSNVNIHSLRQPVIRLAMPPVAHAGESTTVRAELTDGSPSGLTYTWHSTMADSGLATVTNLGDTLRLVYSSAGTDTITVVATNAYGSDTATSTLAVQACATIDTLPWVLGYRASITCWRFYNYTVSNNSNWHNDYYGYLRSSRSASFESANNWLVSPAIELPDTLDASVLRWTLKSTTETINNTIYHAHMDVLLSTTDATDTSTFSHVLFSGYINTGGGESTSRTYEASLDSFAGQTIHIAFVHRKNRGGYINIDSIRIENGGRPQIALTPPAALNTDEVCRVTAQCLSGARNSLAYAWHSTMAARGLATLTPSADTVNIVYLSAGTDTISCVATNAFGSDTQTVVMMVHDCPAQTIPWLEEFEDSTTVGCWSNFSYHYNSLYQFVRTEVANSWHFAGDSTAHRMESQTYTYDWLISPRIALPARADSMTLTWQQSTNFMGLTVLLSPNGRFDTPHDFTDTLLQADANGWHTVSLDSYAGQTIRIAFRTSSFNNAWLDNVMIVGRLAPDTLWRTLAASSADTAMGRVDGGGIYPDSTLVTLMAMAFDGYEFTSWNDGDTANPRQVLLVSDTAFTAIFQPVVDTVWHTLTASSADTAMGRVDGGGIYPDSTLVTLTAMAFDGYEFTSWNDGDTANPRQVLLVSDTVFTAIFQPVVDTVWRTLTANSVDTTMGIVEGGGIYPDSTLVTLTATAFEGYEFAHWHDGDTANPRYVLLVSDTAFTTLFRPVEDTLSIADPECRSKEPIVYPNPASGNVTVRVWQRATVTVIDLTGRTVMAPTTIDDHLTIQRTDLQVGIYFISVTTPSGTTVHKLTVVPSK